MQNPSIQDFLIETLDLAGRELSERFGGALKISVKPDASLVTDADLASERVILERIRRYFPDDLILSEEFGKSGTERKEGAHIWVIDPLDGTTNFANRYPFFCVSICRARFGGSGIMEPVLGGIGHPMEKKTYIAQKNLGAFLNGKPIQVASPRPLDRAFLVTGFYYQEGAKLEEEVRRFAAVAATCTSIRRDGAAALDLAYVAEGVFDAFWERGLAPWDTAAGMLLISEAGGVTQNYSKVAPCDIEGDGIIAGSAEMVRQLGQFF